MCTILRIVYLRIRGAWKTINFNPRPPLPPSVADLLNDPSSVDRRHPSRNHPSFPPNHLPDSPLASLYRIYEYFVTGKSTLFVFETEWFQHCAHWAVYDIPDPKDTDPLRYAILAGLTEILCVGFNRVIAIGKPRGSPFVVQTFEELATQPKRFETLPEWALKVAPLPEKVFVPNKEGQIVAEEKSAYALRKFNIYMEPQSLLWIPWAHNLSICYNRLRNLERSRSFI